MRNLRKAVAALLVFVMVIGTVAFAAKVPEDVIDTEYEEAVTTLAALDILEGRDTGEFDPEGNINRAEFAAVAIRALGLESSVSAAAYEPTSFTDCGSDVQWAWGYINLASKQGIIEGYGDGTFGPTDPVTYEQAVAMLVRILGLDVFAQRKGGWPDGYLVVAAENKITSGVPGTNNQPASRGTVALLTYNSLEVNLGEASYIDSDGNAVTIITNKTLLKDKLEVEKKYGVLVSTEFSAVEGAKNKAGEVSFKASNGQGGYYSKETAKVGADVNPSDLLGYAVSYYLKYDKTRNEYTAISVQEDKTLNKTITVAAEDLADSTLSTFRYWEDKVNDDEATEETLDATILVNGVIDNGATDATLNPEIGSVTIVDNDGDDVYEVVFVKEYLNFVVDSVNTDRNYIDFKDNNSVQLDASKSDKYTFSLTLDGEAIELKDLKEYDILSVIADNSKDGEISDGPNSDPYFETAQIYVTRNAITGTIDELNEKENAGSTTYIDAYILDEEGNSTKYKFGPKFNSSIALGDEGTFYLDFEGRIAYADTSRVLGNYAYVIDSYATGSAARPTANFRLLTAEGEKIDVAANKEIQLNGVKTPAVDENYEPVVGIGELITYEMADGYISSIDKYVSNEGGSYLKEFSRDYVGTDARYINGMFADQYVVGTDTVVFEIPTSESGYDAEEDMAVRGKSAFSENRSYDVEIYDVDKNGVVSVIVYRPTAGSEKMDNALAIVKRISRTMVDGATVDRLTAYQTGAEIRLTTTGTSVFASAYTDTFTKDQIELNQGLDPDSSSFDPTEEVGSDGSTAKNYGEWYAAYNIAYNYFPGNLILYSQNSKGEIDSAMKIYPNNPGLVGFYDADDSEVIKGDKNIGEYKVIPYRMFDNQYNPKERAQMEITVGTVIEKNNGNFLVSSKKKNPDIPVIDPNKFYDAFVDSDVRVNMESNTNVYYVDTNKKQGDNDDQVVQSRGNSMSYVTVGDTVVVRKYEGKTRDIVVYNNYDVSIYNNLFVPLF